ncbi:DUF7007 domain-containing protein [Pelagibacterium lentulum]|uniref:DUF7007 domain-containing protein n=1 Tax=Pelagibacterium lentulum TaxID=2029865 RepID=A0A916W422_9HYPH|nr:hypothetical protein [Pelagibacterium lentulum]GGA64213.1 hypothetical protein GCM10011499_38310 [Pelagibacterium lentulum]
MSAHSCAAGTTHTTPGTPGVLFGRSADGMLVALIGDHAFAMAPARDGRHYLVTGWRIRRPMTEWTRDDFYGHSGELADEDAFRAKVLEQAEHTQEKAALGRRDIRSSAHTPWGSSQGATVFAEGVICHSTAGHGGFHLSVERNAKVHPLLRAADGFYEEDACWSIVAITFPHLFTAFERRCAERTIKDGFPDAWESITGTVLQPGESRRKDELAFYRNHASDWIVISAIRSDHHPGFTEVVATRGGKRERGADERRFLVPSGEYRVGRFGFIVDESRHRPYDGPSSFIGWQGRGK